MPNAKLLYLSRRDVERTGLCMAEVIELLEGMFAEKGAGRVEMPPKPGVHTRPDAFIHAMPAWVAASGAVGVKWVSGYPENPARGLPYVSGLMILNDPDTGLPLAVMDATWITAMRTGAATAVAARRLARPESATLAVVACGVQGRSNLQALAEVFDLREVRAFDLRREVAEAFARDMTADARRVRAVETVRAAVEGADLVVTSGPILRAPEPVIEPEWLAPGSFACALDFDSYFTPAAFRAADRLFTDDRAQMESYRRSGYFAGTPAVEADLGELVHGDVPGRADAHERIVCVNLGLALEDVVTARALYDRAREQGIGAELDL